MKWVMLAVLFLIVGCTPRIEYRTIYLLPDKTWYQQVPAATPPDRAAFTRSNHEQRLGMCATALSEQSTQLETCNLQLDKIEKWAIEKEAENEGRTSNVPTP